MWLCRVNGSDRPEPEIGPAIANILIFECLLIASITTPFGPSGRWFSYAPCRGALALLRCRNEDELLIPEIKRSEIGPSVGRCSVPKGLDGAPLWINDVVVIGWPQDGDPSVIDEVDARSGPVRPIKGGQVLSDHTCGVSYDEVAPRVGAPVQVKFKSECGFQISKLDLCSFGGDKHRSDDVPGSRNTQCQDRHRDQHESD